MFKILAAVAILAIAYISDQLVPAILLIVAWFGFSHFIHRNFIATALVAGAAGLAAYNSIQSGTDMTEAVVGSVLIMAVLMVIYNLAFSRR